MPKIPARISKNPNKRSTMGNYASCALSPRSASSRSSSAIAKVILPTQEVRYLKEETKAAELMMEFPSYFLVNSCSMQIGRRFCALSADEDMEFGNLYLMFPMRRVNSTVGDGDLAVLFMAAKMKMVVAEADRKEGGEIVKTDEHQGSVCDFKDVEGSVNEDLKYRMSMCRSRKPKLETIKEEPIY